ncbi:Ig-like domain-containing protein [Pseudomonas aeruginosa]|uniref:Ig-like domain-containing protein n=1 Tax=Pseudomonas aeruginosa TaxID=287 RepID=UPI001968A627|nr:Ig-like domain-containing protein [Pseudomonas aeruginosa]
MAGNVSPAVEAGVADLTPPRVPLGDESLQLIDDVDPIVGLIKHNGKTNDEQPTFSGKVADVNDVSAVNIYDNDVLIGSAPVDAAGNWTFIPDGEHKLGQGAHSFQATSVDVAGNESTKTAGWNFTVDTEAPILVIDSNSSEQLNLIDDVGSKTGPIAKGGVTDDAKPAFQGKVPLVGDIVAINVYDNGELIGSAVVNANGTWSFTPSTDLVGGLHNFQAATVDGAGNESARTESWGFTVDTLPPTELPQGDDALQLIDDVGAKTGLIAKGDVTDDAKPQFMGKRAPVDAALVNIYDNGALIGSTSVKNGEWNFEPSQPLQAGSHNFQAAAVDAVGNEGEKTADWSFTVKLNAPQAPSLNHVSDNFGLITSTHLQPGSVTDDKTPTVSGTAEPGAVVYLYVNGGEVGRVAADAEGNWSITVSDLGADGIKVITAKAVDKAGQASPQTGGFTVVLDTTAPLKPGVPSVEDNVGAITGLITGSVTDDTTPTFGGSSEPGATVTIKDSGRALGSVPVGIDGKWSFTPSEPMAEGEHSITTQVTDPAGNVSEPSDALKLVVNTQVVNVSVAKALDAAGDKTGDLTNNATTDDSKPTLVGTATAGALVTVMAGSNVLGSVVADVNGNWTLELPQQADGVHSYSAVASNGANTANASFGLTIDSLAPSKPGVITAIDDQGEVTGPITSGVTDDATPTFGGTAEPGSVITIKDGNKILGSVPVSADGTWLFTPPALADGELAISVTATDKAGNVSEPSEILPLKVDTSEVKVSITQVADNVGGSIKDIAKGGWTNDSTPTLHGKGVAGETVHVSFKDGAEIGTATVDAQGNWNFQLPVQADGDLTYVAIIDNGANSASAEFNVRIDTVAPAKPQAIGAIDDQGKVTGNIEAGAITDDNLPTLNGQAEPGSTVTLKDGERVLGSAKVGEAGRWTFTPQAPLGEGEHRINVEAIDAAGNTSEPSDVLVFTVDTAVVTVSVTKAVDNTGNKTGDLGDKSITDDTRPTLVGTATAGAVVSILLGTTELGSVLADEFGKWSFELPEQADGTYSYGIVARGANGNEAGTSFELTIDTAAPDVPEISRVLDDVGSKTGDVSNGGFTDDQSPTLYGTSDAEGDLINIYDNGELLGSVVAGSGGAWNWNPTGDTEKLSEGQHKLSVIATDKAGNESAHSRVFEVNVDITAPGAISALNLHDNVGAFIGTIGVGQATDDSTPTYSGLADPASGATSVNIYDNEKLLGATAVNADGTWSFTPGTPLQDSQYNFSAAALDAAGNEGPRTENWRFSILTVAPERPLIIQVSDDFGPKQGDLLKEGASDDTTLTLSGTGQAGTMLYLYARLSEDGPGTLVGSALIDVQGKWEVTTSDLYLQGSDGMKYFYAQAQDTIGQWSGATDNFPIELYTKLPVAPEVLSFVTKDFFSQVSGNLTQDRAPTVTGKGEPGSLVTLSDNGVVLGSTKVDAQGDWSFTPQSPLLDGEHVFTVESTDKVGNSIKASEPWLFVVDTLPPKIGLDVNTAEQLAGETEPGVVVTLAYKGGSLHTTADQNGRWSIRPNPLAQGEKGNLSGRDVNGLEAPPVEVQGAALGGYPLDSTSLLVNSTTLGPQFYPSSTILSDGKVIVVVWESGDVSANAADVHMQLFAADGVTRIGTEQRVNQSDKLNQSKPQVKALADGGYLVVWQSNAGAPDSSGYGIMARRYGSDGKPLGDEFGVNITTAGHQITPTVIAHADGGYTISWPSRSGKGDLIVPGKGDLIVQRTFDAQGKPLTGDVTVANFKSYAGGDPKLAMAAFTDPAHDGMYVTLWDHEDQDQEGIVGQIFKRDGTLLGKNFQVNSIGVGSQHQSDVITLTDGTFLVVWRGSFARHSNKSDVNIYMGRYSVEPSTGAVQQISAGDQLVTVRGVSSRPTAVALDDGGYLIIWTSRSSAGSGSVMMAQRYSASNEKLGQTFIVNPNTEGNQGDTYSSIGATLLPDGNVYVTWPSSKADGSSWGIESTVVNINAGYYSEFTVNSTFSGDQDKSASARLPKGGFVVVWESATGDDSGDCVMAQLFGATGMPVGREFVVNKITAGFQGNPTVVALEDNGFVVSWTHSAAAPLRDDVMQRKYSYIYDLKGQVSGVVAEDQERMVNVNSIGNQRDSSIAVLGDGSYWVTWKSAVDGKWHIYARQYKGDGSPVDEQEMMVGDTNVPATTNGVRATGISALDDGRVVFSYSYNTGGAAAYDVHFRIYDPVTRAFGAPKVANLTTADNQASPSVACLANGNFVITWESNNKGGQDTSGYGIWGRIFNATGEPVSGEFLVNGRTLNNQTHPVVIAHQGGGFVVIYQSQSDLAPGANTYGIYAQYFDETGQKVGAELHINHMLVGDQTQVSASFLDSGKLFVSWTDGSGASDGSGSAVKGRLVDLDATLDLESLGLSPQVPEAGAIHIPYRPTSEAMGSADNDMIDARGYTYVSGGQGNDAIIIDGTGFRHIDGGAGHDTLVWASHNPLNLATIANKVDNVEAIHMSEGVSQLLTLTLSDLLRVTGRDADGEQTLKITGDIGQNGVFDTVDIDLDAWSKATQVTERNVVYDVYDSTSASYAHLLIQEGLHVV